MDKYWDPNETVGCNLSYKPLLNNRWSYDNWYGYETISNYIPQKVIVWLLIHAQISVYLC